MKNKLLSFVLALCLIVPCAVIFSACGDGKAPTTIYVNDVAGLEQAVNKVANNGTIILNSDITIKDSIKIDKKITLDLNGKKISNTESIKDVAEGKLSLISVCTNGDLTIKGEGTLQAKLNDCFAVDVRNGSKLTIEDGTFVGNISAVYVHEGEAIINGGTYSIRQIDSKGYTLVVDCYDANYAAGDADIIINGGSFVKYSPTANISEGLFVAEDKVVAATGSSTSKVYTVASYEDAREKISGITEIKSPIGERLVYDSNSLAKSLDSNDTLIKLVEDINLGGQINVSKNVVIDLNGKTISNAKDIWNDEPGENAADAWSLISVKSTGNLTIKNGTLQAKENDCYAIDVRYGGKLTIESGNYIGNISAIYVAKGEVVINGGMFSIQQVDSNGYSLLVNCLNDNYTEGTAKITINGGSFVNYDPTAYPTEGNFLAEGLTVESVNAGLDTIYDVVVQEVVEPQD